jgi:hypothetical protein
MRSRASLLWALCAIAPACAFDDSEDEAWIEFRDSAAREVEGRTIYIVEFDLVMSEDELYGYYRRHVVGDVDGEGTSRQASTVNQENNADDVWGTDAAQRLTYCVSTDFGLVNRPRAIQEMAIATREWEAVAHVNFVYLGQHDTNCSNANTNVTFSVRPWTLGGACAFFPGGNTQKECVARTVLVDYNDFDTNPQWDTDAPNMTTLGVIRHELGHVLGLRHEHIRNEAAVNGVVQCQETNDFRTLTTYDNRSVMHYPWCNGVLASDLSITDSDVHGIQQLYFPSFAPSETQFVIGNTDGNPRRDIVQYHRGWHSLPTCRYTGNNGGNSFQCSNPSATIHNWSDPRQQLLLGDFNDDGYGDAVQAYRKWGSYPTCLSTLNGWQCSNPSATILQHPDDTNEQQFLTGNFLWGAETDIAQVYREWSSIPVCSLYDGVSPSRWLCSNSSATIYDWGDPEQQFLVADVDNNGTDDIVQTYRRWGSLPVCRSDGFGNWSCANLPATIHDANSYEQRFHAGDVDGDYDDDIIQTFRGWHSIPVCRSNGGTSWSCANWPATIHDSGSHEQQFLTGDFDGNGKTDVVQAFRGWGSLPLCLSTGSGWTCSNQAATIYNSGSREQRFLAADVDNDGRTDIVQVHRGWSSYPVCFSRPGYWDCQNLPATIYNPGVL